MNIDREQRWQAYLDGELSACEAAEFEATLTESERGQLAAEMRFDRALAERLREGGACPDEVWARAQTALRAQVGPRSRAVSHRRWVLATVALATAILAVVTLPKLYPLGIAGVLEADVIHAASSIEALAAVSETEPGQKSIEDFLHANGIALDVATDEAIRILLPFHRYTKLLGARQERFAGTQVTELLVDCCGKPIKVILAPRGSRAARVLVNAAEASTHVESTQTVGGYTAAVVGQHPAAALVNLVHTAAR